MGEKPGTGVCIWSFPCGSKHRGLLLDALQWLLYPLSRPWPLHPFLFVACPPSSAVCSLCCFIASSTGGCWMICWGLGHHQGFPSSELAQHVSAGCLFLATFLPMKKSSLCLSVFLPFRAWNIRHLTSQIFLDKEVENWVKLGEVVRILGQCSHGIVQGKGSNRASYPQVNYEPISLRTHFLLPGLLWKGFAILVSLLAVLSLLDGLWSQSTQGVLWGPILRCLAVFKWLKPEPSSSGSCWRNKPAVSKRCLK